MSLWLMRLPTDRIRRQRRAREGAQDRSETSALVVTSRQGNAERLVAVDARAERLGLLPGLTLAEARARHPDLAVVAEDRSSDLKILNDMADWCRRYTPLVAIDPPDGLLLDIAGCAHLFGGEDALAGDLLTRVTNFGFDCRLAIASTIGAAWASARYGTTMIAENESSRTHLGPLPLAALRLPGEMVAALKRVGLKRIGDILDLPRAPLAARFGSDLLRQLDRAIGAEREPLMPLFPLAPYVAEHRFAEPIGREEDVLGIAERLADRLKAMLERCGEGARLIELALFRTDGVVRCLQAATSRPVRDPRAIRALFVERLASLADALDPGFGFDLARLSVLLAEPSPTEQVGFDASEDPSELDHLIDRLSARLGSRRVTRLIAQDSHIPELAVMSLPAQTKIAAETGWATFQEFRTQSSLSPRPLRLLAKPEPIEAVAAIPDGPPVRFRWRRALHQVVAAEGPERIEGIWWSEDGGGPARDYFRVEDEAGRRFWLFRAGLYRLTTQPRWFLHGMFA
jgi:protein ImuB